MRSMAGTVSSKMVRISVDIGGLSVDLPGGLQRLGQGVGEALAKGLFGEVDRFGECRGFVHGFLVFAVGV